jgi:aspartyl-tRNA(Asn)/glutamyl-tRNA(Gln) amidotransferase subunit A
MSELWALSATELVEGFRRKTLSPVEVTKAVLARIEKLNPVLNAFRQVAADEALQQARDSEIDGRRATERAARRRAGLDQGHHPHQGWPTLRGSKTVDPKGPWNDDAPVTARLREHGAVLLGKTTTPEFGWKGVTDSPLTGITRNPWNRRRRRADPRAARPRRSLPAWDRSRRHRRRRLDPHSRARSPACSASSRRSAACRRGRSRRSARWRTSGPMTRTVGDAALMLNVIAQPDARDWHALPYDARDWRMGLDGGVADLRIAYSPNLGYAKVDPEVAALVKKAVSVFEELGAKVEEKDPGFADPAPVFTTHWFSGAAFLLKGIRNQELVDPGLRRWLARARRSAPTSCWMRR